MEKEFIRLECLKLANNANVHERLGMAKLFVDFVSPPDATQEAKPQPPTETTAPPQVVAPPPEPAAAGKRSKRAGNSDPFS